jgi:hypothetical protein
MGLPRLPGFPSNRSASSEVSEMGHVRCSRELGPCLPPVPLQKAREGKLKGGVGQSNRTLGKHILLHKMLGREVGMMAKCRPNFISNQYLIVDLCAGDGKPSHQSEKCSPEIAQKHLAWLKGNSRAGCALLLVEKDAYTFSTLSGQGYAATLLNIDASTLDGIPVDHDPRAAIFIHADPNHVNDWPLSDRFVENLPQYTTMLITLGCNVGGLKRLPLAERMRWFDRVDRVLSRLPQWHDALLVVLNGDKAQWAYMITGPKTWREKYEKDAAAAFKYLPNGISMVWFRADEENFYATRERLFLTAKECGNV